MASYSSSAAMNSNSDASPSTERESSISYDSITKIPEQSHGPIETIKPNPGPAHPTHYLCRGGGRFTPLIALDELPSHLKLVGLPLSLSFKEIVDVGGSPLMPAVEKAKESYLVVLGSGSEPSRSQDLSTADLMSAQPGANKSMDIPSSGTINARLSRAIDGVGPSTDPETLKKEILQLKAKKGSNHNQRYNPTTPGVLGQKVYCTHWMRTGECDFTQQGCMFLHAMPDLDTLELLGFRSYPRWFREMPRDFQLSNAKDFDEVGLDIHRHAQRQTYGSDARNGQWFNQPNQFMNPRNSPSPNFGQSPQFSPPMQIPMQSGPWSVPGFNHAQLPTPRHSPAGSFGNDHYNRPFSPDAFGNAHPAQPYFGGQGPHSIWSRTTSPAMDAINRLHKPLSPEITAIYPTPMTPAFSGPPSLSSPVSSPLNPIPTMNRLGGFKHNAEARNGKPKGNAIHPANERGRGRQARRQNNNQNPKTPTKSTDNNPYSALNIEGSSSGTEPEK